MPRKDKRTQPGTVLLLAEHEIQPNPHQPRRQFCTDELGSLAQSIRENGILQPLTVRRLPDGRHELVAGERRLRAAHIAGLEKVPCLLTQVSDEQSAILALVENMQRADLSYFEEAMAIHQLMKSYRITQEQAARSLGMAPSTLSNKLRLLKLPIELRDKISAAKLTERHARALLRVTDPLLQRDLLQRIIQRELNVQDTDGLVASVLADVMTPPKQRSHVRVVRDVRIFVNTIHHAVDTMRSSGINAVSEKTENDDFLIYTVLIPKGKSEQQALKRAS